MSGRRGLGKGLAALIPATEPLRPGEAVHELALELIEPNPYQPRRDFDRDALAELAASIEAQGLLQPIIVRPIDGGRYQLVAGERRLRAVRDLGRVAIGAIVREVPEREMLQLSLVENLLRSDLNDIEVAEAFQQLQSIYGYTITQLAEVTGKSRPAVSNTLRLLELPEQVQALIRAGRLSAGHGRAVLSFPPESREVIASQCAEEGWSVRELERRSDEASQRTPRRRPRSRTKSLPAALRRVEKLLEEHLGTRVRVSEGRGASTIQITYHDADDLERILDLLLRGRSPI